MTYTQAQIDKANAVDLEKFLRAQGETLVRSGKECRWKAHDSLTVCGNKWFRHSQSKGGFPVDFVMEFYGKSFPEAVQMLTGEPGEVQPEADPAPSPAFRLPLRNVTNANILNYLTQERKLSPSLVNFFIAAGDIYEDSSHHNVVFVGRDADGHPRYASSRGIREKFRQDAAGAEKAFGFAHRGTDKQLLVFEAPVDLLSFIELFQKTGSSTIICHWTGCRARRCGSFSQNAQMWSGCSSVWMPTKLERMPASGWRGCCRTR